MRIFLVHPDRFTELDALPEALPEQGFLWIGCARPRFEQLHALLQQRLQAWGVGALVDLHVSDLLNAQLPSHFDYTSWYDLMVIRRLVAPPALSEGGNGPIAAPAGGSVATLATHAPLPPIDTSAVGFAVYDRLLLTVHPPDCAVRDHFALRMASLAPSAATGADMRFARLPTSPADQMLRMINHMVDGYLELRRQLSRQLGALQRQLLDGRSAFLDWHVLLESRSRLDELEDTCEDQRSAVQEWIDALDEWPDEATEHERRERELLRVRSRDVLEHIERVLTHVRRLTQSAEAAVQLHFSALSQRTNDIMRTLTVLTAVFLPLNLITGFFGMNFDRMPLIHDGQGVWLASAVMLALALGLGWFFWRRRYLGSLRRHR